MKGKRPPLCGLVVDWLDDQSSGGDWRERFLRAGFRRGAPRDAGSDKRCGRRLPGSGLVCYGAGLRNLSSA